MNNKTKTDTFPACAPAPRAVLAVPLLALALGGCATTGSAPADATPTLGTVQSIQESEAAGGWQSLTGSIVGMVVGAVAGSQIGKGTGNTIASILTSSAGAGVGSYAGGMLGKTTTWAVTVRGADGIDRTVRTTDRPNFQPGARVKVTGSRIETQ